MTTTKTAKGKTAITAAAIYRCNDKVTHETFYMVASDTQTGEYYQVRFNHRAARWECGCPSAYPCKHVRAVNEVLAVRRQRIAEEMGGNIPAVVATMQAEEDKKYRQAEVSSSIGTKGTLHGNNKGFDLLG